MATLPALPMSDEQSTIVLAAFGGEAAYVKWAYEMISAAVVSFESAKIATEQASTADTRLKALRAKLPPQASVPGATGAPGK